MNNYLYYYGNAWYVTHAEHVAALNRIKQLETELEMLRTFKGDEAANADGATAPFEPDGPYEPDAKSDDVRSDYRKGYDEGFSEGYDHAKAEILIEIIKAVNVV